MYKSRKTVNIQLVFRWIVQLRLALKYNMIENRSNTLVRQFLYILSIPKAN